jgi:MYXO-CTERM domain-containing protein
MRNRSPVISMLAFGLFGLGALSARSAFADTTCAKDGDCVKGWVCQVTGSSGCGYACAPGTDCPPPPDCGVQETKSCVPGPCSADSDCASGMVCYTTQVGCPSTPPCAAGADCTEPPACQPTTQSACIPRYDAPCKADADCGAGFSCIANQSECNCASAGSAPGSSADGGSADPVPPMIDCQCPPSTTSSCHALPVACASAADCAAGWSCESLPTSGCAASSPSTPPAPGGNGAADGGAAPPVQDAGVDPCPPPPPAMKQCMPPYYSLGGGSFGVSGSGQANDTPTAGGHDSDAGTTPKSPNGDTATGTDQNSTSAGCSVAHGAGPGSSGVALFVLGLFGWLRRRREQRIAR